MIRQDIQDLIREKLINNSEEIKQLRTTWDDLNGYVNDLVVKYTPKDFETIKGLLLTENMIINSNVIELADILTLKKLPEQKRERANRIRFSWKDRVVNNVHENITKQEEKDLIEKVCAYIDAAINSDNLCNKINNILSSMYLNSDIISKALPKTYKNLTQI